LRLAVVSPFVDRSHGTERALAELLERLASRHNCEIHLYAQSVRDLTVTEPGAPQTRTGGAIIWHKVPVLRAPHLIQFPAWLVTNSVLRWFHRLSGRVRADLVISPGINCFDADIIMIHVLFHRLRDLSREQNADARITAAFLHLVHRRLYYGLLAALEQRIYRNPQVRLTCVSRRTAQLLGDYFGRRDARVIPNGIDPRQFSPSLRESRRAQARLSRNFQATDFVVLLLGNDWAVKGVLAILAAMAAAPALPLHLLVVGRDSVDPFREMAGRLNLTSRFHWELPKPDVMDFYGAADVYVSPSREDSFGLPVLEAMACGLPVITSVFAGVADLIIDGIDGFVLRDPHDSLSLSQLLQRLYEDEALRKRIAEAAPLTAGRWTWQHNADEIWNVLKCTAEREMAAH